MSRSSGPKVSIVVPVYNVDPALLSLCFASVERQTFRQSDFEAIIVDDCSDSAETIAVIDEFVERVGNASLVRHETNRGLNEARRSGTRVAVGEFVTFLDGDDMLARDAAEAFFMESVALKVDIVTAPLVRWDPVCLSFDDYGGSGQALSESRNDRLKEIFTASHSFTMCGRAFRRELLSDDVFDMPAGVLHEDITTTPRALAKADRVGTVQKPLYFYTVNPDSITGELSERRIDGIFSGVASWVALAEGLGVLREVGDAISTGAEKFVNTFVERSALGYHDLDTKISLLRRIAVAYGDLRVERAVPTLPGSSFLEIFRATVPGSVEERQVLEAYVAQHQDDFQARRAPARTKEMAHRLRNSRISLACKDKVVFVCQVDYQVRTAARLARELRKQGIACVILDNSRVVAGGKRASGRRETELLWRTQLIHVDRLPYGSDWLATASLVITFNDFNEDFTTALEYRHRLGLPSVCMVEGINDFLRVDAESVRSLPYRRCDVVFLAGQHDKRFFEDRRTAVVGLPNIEDLYGLNVTFPEQPVMALNVNFTYGVLEDRREQYVKTALKGAKAAGFDVAITQHPMDKGSMPAGLVTESTQYELIEQTSVFVSRFATGILEALASGKPVIYFNPHGEQVEKFGDPMGAFEVATTADELAAALGRVQRDIADGIDFRARAAAFMKFHASVELDQKTSVERFSDAVKRIIVESQPRQIEVASRVLNTLTGASIVRMDDDLIMGNMEREHHVQLNEEELIGRYFGERIGLMIDVGANVGNSLDIFLGKGWMVHAFEPDAQNRMKLLDHFPPQRRLVVNDQAVSSTHGQRLPFFASDESVDINGLSPFIDSHEQVSEVMTTTLDHYMAARNIEHVDFLKIDVEGFDKFVLDGFPWDRDLPDVVLTEFEDAKTVPLGYTTGDMAQQLIDLGYVVYTSEWHPIIRYGTAHDWRCMRRYDPDYDVSNTWGNLIAFRELPDENRLAALLEMTLKVSPQAPKPAQPAASSAPARRRWSTNRADTIRRHSPGLYKVVRRLRHALTRQGVAARERSLLARIAQLLWWVGKAAAKRVALTATLAVVLTAAVVTAVVVDSDSGRVGAWVVVGLACVLAAGLAAAAIFREAFRRLDAKGMERLISATDKLDRTITSLVQQAVTDQDERSDRLMRPLRRDIERLAERTSDVERRAGDVERRAGDLRRDLKQERSERMLADAAMSSGAERDVVVLVTAQRTGSTVLFDRLRLHPSVEVEGVADTWRALGQSGRRYPSAFSDVDSSGQAIEVENGSGAMIPGRPLLGSPLWFVEKTHPEFFDFDVARLLDGVHNLEAAGRRVEVVLGIRDPVETMWSMAAYQQRDPGWYAWLDPAGIPDFVARSFETLAGVATSLSCRIMDYSGPPSQRAMLHELAVGLFGDSAEAADSWIDAVEAETVAGNRARREGSGFIGAPTTTRDPLGPDGIWSSAGVAIERAAAAYAAITGG